MNREEIRSLRFRLRLSQSDFARRLGVSVDTVRSWERRKPAPPSAMNLYALRELEAESIREKVAP